MSLFERLFSTFKFSDAVLIEDTYQHLGFHKPRKE